MGGLELRLMLWDTAGQEEFHSITRKIVTKFNFWSVLYCSRRLETGNVKINNYTQKGRTIVEHKVASLFIGNV